MGSGGRGRSWGGVAWLQVVLLSGYHHAAAMDSMHKRVHRASATAPHDKDAMLQACVRACVRARVCVREYMRAHRGAGFGVTYSVDQMLCDTSLCVDEVSSKNRPQPLPIGQQRQSDSLQPPSIVHNRSQTALTASGEPPIVVG